MSTTSTNQTRRRTHMVELLESIYDIPMTYQQAYRLSGLHSIDMAFAFQLLIREGKLTKLTDGRYQATDNHHRMSWVKLHRELNVMGMV